MKLSTILAIILSLAATVSAQKSDTRSIGPRDLQLRNLQLGDSTYVVYQKKNANAPAEKITLVRIRIEATAVQGRKAFAISQQWESGDEVVHTSKTLHSATDFSTLFHETWWKRLGYSSIFDFTGRHVEFKGPIDDAKKSQIVDDFNKSFENFNLCWHNDLIIFGLLPYQEGRLFVINFYDPGFGKAKAAEYRVVGSESLIGSEGSRIDCWVMEHTFEIPAGGNGKQRFWISKRTHEVLKEEDQTPNGYRYKLKIGISGEK